MFAGLNRPMQFTKLIFSSYINNNEEKLLDHALGSQFVSFNQNKVIISDVDIDRVATLENQVAKRVTFKHYSGVYKDGLEYLAAMISEGIITQQDIKKMIKRI